jgi:hypothetical protein
MSELKLNMSWSKGLTPQEDKELRADILSAPVLRKRLKALLEEKERDADKSSFSLNNIDKPNWELRLAENCGYRRALSEIISLIP